MIEPKIYNRIKYHFGEKNHFIQFETKFDKHGYNVNNVIKPMKM
jgi:hypothetical protein